MTNIFTKHPKSIGESYFQHLRFATVFGLKMVMGGCACLLHAVFPFMFEKTGSNLLLKMTEDFINRMPVVEDRILMINKKIERKVQAN